MGKPAGAPPLRQREDLYGHAMARCIKYLQKPVAYVRRRVAGSITHVSTTENAVALTFDDGPDPEFTPRLVDMLARYQAHATFFFVGRSAQQYPEVVRQVAQAGHAIGNHTWDHPSLPLISGRERRAQIQACAKALAPYGQRLLRFPYGHQDVASGLDALWLGYQVNGWNLLGYDWLDHGAEWIAGRLVGKVRRGSVILLHDALYYVSEAGPVDRRPTLQAVEQVLRQTGGRFRFVTVPELLRLGRARRQVLSIEPDPDWLQGLYRPGGEPRRDNDGADGAQ